MAVACQKTIVSDAGYELQKESVGLGLGAAVAAWYFVSQYDNSPTKDTNALMSGLGALLVGGVVPYAVGQLLNTYGKMCKA